MGDNLCEEELTDVGSVGVEVIRVAADLLPLNRQENWDGVLGG